MVLYAVFYIQIIHNVLGINCVYVAATAEGYLLHCTFTCICSQTCSYCCMKCFVKENGVTELL